MKANLSQAEALTAIRAMQEPTITPELAASALGCDPQKLRVQAANKPELLGFPVIRIGTRTKIPRIPFLRFMGWMKEEGRDESVLGGEALA